MKTLNWTDGRRMAALKSWFCGWLLAAMTATALAAPLVNPSDPNSFFTTVASRLLASEMGVNLSSILIYPTNNYTPAVHRLLQVTANIYDCTTTNYYPSVFRPLFWKTNELTGGVPQTNIYVVGYQYVPEPFTITGPPIFTPPVDVSDPSVPFGLSGLTNNIYGIPWVLGVKKGLPNFNALEMENVVSVQRQLQFDRNSSAVVSGGVPFPFGRIYTTNQMYIMSISNYLGVEFWNSYASNYPGPLTIYVFDRFSMDLTNDAGGTQPVPPFNTYLQPGLTISQTNIVGWSGYRGLVTGDPSFVVPLVINRTWLTNSVYYYGPTPQLLNGTFFTGPGFIPVGFDQSNFLDSGTPPLPNFGLTITNRLQAYILDTNNCLLDYVQLNGMDSSLNLNASIADADDAGLWSTNFFNYGGNTPFGVLEQFLVSAGFGAIPGVDNDGGFWVTTPILGNGSDVSPAAQAAFFQAFFSSSDTAAEAGGSGAVVSNFNLSVRAPFTPARKVVQRQVFAANDPLVHYLASDLQDYPDDINSRIMDSPPLNKLGAVNDCYMPWGINGVPTFNGIPIDNNSRNPAYKDPQVKNSDNWNFPTNETLDASWLGQVHRGTPWQSIYLKSTNVLGLYSIFGPTGLATWEYYSGDTNPADAANMAPVTDWHMASYLASLFETNYPSLFSVDDTNAIDWKALLNGMAVLTNDLRDQLLQFGTIPPQFVMLTISSNSSQAAAIANAVQTGQRYTNVGDIFAISQLSDASPYLNTDAVQVQNGINDAAYEAIPSQLLPLLRVDSFGSVTPVSGHAIIHFTGDDNHAYAVQTSCDLIHWQTLSTNCPFGGSFSITNTFPASHQFYRSVLLR